MAYGEYSSSKLKSVPLPDKFCCDQCKKWKPNCMYSNKQLNDFRRGKRKIRCMDCTIDQRAEMTCEGPCSETKALDKFSKNARGAHGSHWCEECTLWKASAAAGVQTGPAPGQAPAPDEVLHRGAVEETESLWEGGNDDDRTDLASNATSAWYKVNPTSSGATLANNYDGTTSVVEDMNSLRINNRENSYVLPHLRHTSGSAQRFNSAMSSTSSVSNPYGNEMKPVAKGVAVWTKVDEEPEPVRYNAWDSRGTHHVQTRNPSVTTPSVSGPTGSSARGTGTQGGNNWRPVARTVNSHPAATAPPTPAITQAPQRVRYDIEGDSDSDDYGY